MAVAFMTVVDRALVARDLGRRIPVLLHMVQNIRVDYRWPWPVIERFVLRRIDGAVAYSPGARALLRSRGVRGPIPVQPFGVDDRLFRAGSASPIRRRMGPGAPVIGWVGRMHFAKGLHLLLEASARMRRPHRLLVVGDGPRRAEERARAARLGLDRRTTWLPPQPTERMPAVYRAMDIYVHPAISRPKEDPAWRNWKEQFARTLPEAMLSSCAVVGSTSGEIPWVLGGTGAVVPERSPAALARALDRLVASESLRHRLGARARARALTHFTFDAAAAGLLRCWRSLL
jgi:glycosyltransferase involved in cell wall biosynthesis